MTQCPIDKLRMLMKRLRDPETGCPWDREQTIASLSYYTLEETYEVMDAILRQDWSDMCQELGDLLFQIVFYAEIASEKQKFGFDDICQAICTKIERRHPHVFAKEQGVTVENIVQRWEEHKIAEREAKAQFSVMDDIPSTLPELMRTQKIQQRCSSVGFDWSMLVSGSDKLQQALQSVKNELHAKDNETQASEKDLAYLLFFTVNLIRQMGYKAEQLLLMTNKQFEQHFRVVEEELDKQGKTLQQATAQEIDTLCSMSKTLVKENKER